MARGAISRATLSLLAAALPLLACAEKPVAIAPPLAVGECDADDHRALIGRQADALDRDALPGPKRIYRTGSPVTMDHRPDRLNIVVDEAGRIVGVHCG